MREPSTVKWPLAVMIPMLAGEAAHVAEQSRNEVQKTMRAITHVQYKVPVQIEQDKFA
jgi:hypothetical protein